MMVCLWVAYLFAIHARVRQRLERTGEPHCLRHAVQSGVAFAPRRLRTVEIPAPLMPFGNVLVEDDVRRPPACAYVLNAVPVRAFALAVDAIPARPVEVNGFRATIRPDP